MFKGVTMIDQNAINTYRTDLYFPKYKLAIVISLVMKTKILVTKVCMENILKTDKNVHLFAIIVIQKNFKICDVLNQIFYFMQLKE